MRKSPCPKEQDLRDCFKKGKKDPAIEEHVKHCPDCAETLLVVQWMDRFKEESEKSVMEGRRLPSLEVIRQKPVVSRNDREFYTKKAMRLLLIPRILSTALFITALIFIIPRLTEKIRGLSAGPLFKDISLAVIVNPLAFLLFVFTGFFLFLSELRQWMGKPR